MLSFFISSGRIILPSFKPGMIKGAILATGLYRRELFFDSDEIKGYVLSAASATKNNMLSISANFKTPNTAPAILFSHPIATALTRRVTNFEMK